MTIQIDLRNFISKREGNNQIEPQLRKLFPGKAYSFKLLASNSKRLGVGQSFVCDMGGASVELAQTKPCASGHPRSTPFAASCASSRPEATRNCKPVSCSTCLQNAKFLTSSMLMFARESAASRRCRKASAARRLPLTSVGLFQYIAPSVSLVIAVWHYGEPFVRAQMEAFALIWFALLVYSWDSMRARGRRR